MKRSMDAPEKESVHASCCIRMEEIVKSVIVRADDFQHLIENLFHLPHQCKLGAADGRGCDPGEQYGNNGRPPDSQSENGCRIPAS